MSIYGFHFYFYFYIDHYIKTFETWHSAGDVFVSLLRFRMHFVFSFFVRTDSTTVLGCTPPDPYQAPVEEALPLACQPHLLHPAARREQMFGTVHEHTDSDKGTPLVSSMALSREDSETVFCAARKFNEAGVGQEGTAMEVDGKNG